MKVKRTPLGREGIQARWVEAMRAGDFEEAWRQTDRLEIPRRRAERLGRFDWGPEYLIWNGQPFDGQRVMVRCNHGLGDTLQFLRFLPMIDARARSVTVLAQPALLGLLLAGRNQGLGEIRDGWSREPAPEHDVAIEIMETAYAFRVTEASLPQRELSAPVEGPHVGGENRFRVGLHWAASQWDPSRSIPLRSLEPLSALRDEGIRFYSLQQGPQAGEWREHPRFGTAALSPFTREIHQAAAVLGQLDLLITVDSMLGHLAGALGRPVWLLLKFDPDWRWMLNRADCPWYPTMRLFRQERAGDWAGVVEEVRAALEKHH